MRMVIGLVAPLASPVQPANWLPVAGVAVSVTLVPPGNVEPVGLRDTVPEPVTEVVSV
jgi:hypothetical protein